MKDFFAKVWEKLNNPKGWVVALVYISTLLLCGGSIAILFLDYKKTWLEIVAYALFGLAALSLTYATYLFVKIVPRLKSNVIAWLQRYALTDKILKSYGFRTVLFSAFSMLVSVLYGIYNGVLAVIGHSMWYGALAVYYITLVCTRSGIIVYHSKRRGKERSEIYEARAYRNCGWLLISTISALSAAILQMVVAGAGFVHAGLTIYVAAAYTFYKITMSIINMVKARRQDDYTVRAVRSVNLADALVSILALQTAMFQQFSDGTLDTSVANAMTGGAVCALVFALGLYMVINGAKVLKERKRKEEYERNEGKI